MAGEDERATVRQFIEELTEVAAGFPRGLDEPIELAICLRDVKQFIDRVEVTGQWLVSEETGEAQRGSQVILILGHWHPDEPPGRVMRAVTADVDEELRKLAEGGE